MLVLRITGFHAQLPSFCLPTHHVRMQRRRRCQTSARRSPGCSGATPPPPPLPATTAAVSCCSQGLQCSTLAADVHGRAPARGGKRSFPATATRDFVLLL